MDWVLAQPHIVSLMAFSQPGPVSGPAKATPTLNNKYSSYFKYFWNREETAVASENPPGRSRTEDASQAIQEQSEEDTPTYMKSLRLTSDQLVSLEATARI